MARGRTQEHLMTVNSKAPRSAGATWADHVASLKRSNQQKGRPPDATYEKPVAPDELLQASLALRWDPKTKPQRDEVIIAGKAVGYEKFRAYFAASKVDCDSVRAILVKAGFTVTASSYHYRTVDIRGDASLFAQYFGVQLGHYSDLSLRSGDAIEDIRVPAAIADLVTGVFGLDTRPMARSHSAPAALSKAASPGNDLTVRDVMRAYSFPDELTGEGETIAILQFGGAFSTQDLSQARPGLEKLVELRSVDGARVAMVPAPAPGLYDPDVEPAIDTQIAGIAAPMSNIVVYQAPDNTS